MKEEGKKGARTLDNFARLVEERKRLNWEGSFGEYLEKVMEEPALACGAHELLRRACSAPDFFEKADDPLFGSNRAVELWREVLQSAAEGKPTRNRIILFLGPPGSGKSTMVTALKRGIERHTKAEGGAVYAISTCPMREDPLHLVPAELRDQFGEEYGVKIEGDLCPDCALKYGGGDLEALMNIPVNRVFFSERDRVGVGTFAPSDPKSQDVGELTGEVDLSKLGEYGTRADPRAFRFNGELEVANRGVMEFVEILKVDERFLYILLGLAQERVIKVAGFASIPADEVVLAHTNLAEYEAFSANAKNEALKGRMLVIPVPYNLRVSDEKKIYDKLLRRGSAEKHIVGPQTLEIAAMFAVLTRLEESKRGVSNVKKLRLYDGQYVEGTSQKEADELQLEFPREGMTGVSPRYIIDTLSMALTRGIKEGRPCLTPIDALRALKNGLDYHMDTRDLTTTKKESIINLIAEVRKEYDDEARREVQAAFVFAFEDSARVLFENYVDQVDAFCNKRQLKDMVTGEDIDPDEKMMRGIEEQIAIGESGKAEFRREVLMRIASAARREQKFDYQMHPALKRAIESKLFADTKDFVKLTTSTKTPNKDQQERLSAVLNQLIEKGYCSHCANELIKYVGTLLNR